MTTTGTIAKALRKNTIWPIGATSPSKRTRADIAANSNAEISLRPIALRGYMGGRRFAIHYDDRRKYPRLFSGSRAPGGRQRFDIGRHGLAIGHTQLRRIAHDLDHGAADKVRIRSHAGRKRVGYIFHRPILELLLGDVWNTSLPVGSRPSGEKQVPFDRPEHIARGVTLRAVSGSVHEIRPAIPLRRLRRIRCERPAVEKQKLPQPERATDIEWKRQGMIAHLAGHRRQCLQIGKEVTNVVERHALIRRVGKRREQMLARR